MNLKKRVFELFNSMAEASASSGGYPTDYEDYRRSPRKYGTYRRGKRRVRSTIGRTGRRSGGKEGDTPYKSYKGRFKPRKK